MKVALDRVKLGMEVADDVVNVNGVLLLAKGAQIREGHFRLLKMWGIAELDVVGEVADTAPQAEELPYKPAQLEEATRLVNRRFKHVKIDTDALQGLREMALKRAARRLSREVR